MFGSGIARKQEGSGTQNSRAQSVTYRLRFVSARGTGGRGDKLRLRAALLEQRDDLNPLGLRLR